MPQLLGNILLITALVWTNVVCACAADMAVDPDLSTGAHAHHEMSTAIPCEHNNCDGCAAANAAQISEHKLVSGNKTLFDGELDDISDVQECYELHPLSLVLAGSDPPELQVLANNADTPITRHDTLLE
jgi:hypothetical protein